MSEQGQVSGRGGVRADQVVLGGGPAVRVWQSVVALRCALWPGSAAEESGELIAGAGGCRHGDRRSEQGVPGGARDECRGDHQQAGGQGARDRLALPARPGYVPPVDGDLEGGRGGHDAGRQRAARDLDDLALVAWAGPGLEQLAGGVAECPGGGGRQVVVFGGGGAATVSGSGALTAAAQGL